MTAIKRRCHHVVSVLVLFLVAAVVEIGVLVLVGQAIGVLPTVGLLVAGAVIGGWLLRREGRRTLREFSEAARLRRPPERELSDGVLSSLGGAFILIPGFLSDVAGLLLLLPPSRALARRYLRRLAERRSQALQEQMQEHMHAQTRSSGVSGAGRSRQTGRSADEDVIDGEVVSVSEDDEQPDEGDGASHVLPPQASRQQESPGRERRPRTDP